MTKRRKKVSFTKKVQDFILEKMTQGYDAAQITKRWPDDVPAYETILRKSLEDKDFGDNYNRAYTVLLMRRLDELNEVSSETWCKDRLTDFDGDYKLAFEARRAKMDSLKFMLGKMAPVLSKRFDKAEKVEVEHKNAPQLAIINYHTEPKLDKETKVIDCEEDNKE